MPRLAIITTRLRIRWPRWSGWDVSPAPGSRSMRTDMHLLTKQPIAGYNVRNLNNFDAVFYMGEGPWNITDQQKADLLSFVHDDGKGFIAGHAATEGTFFFGRNMREMIGGNLVGEFPSADMHIVVEDPNFPGVQGFRSRVYI